MTRKMNGGPCPARWFETRTTGGHSGLFDFTTVFAKWMAGMDYRESYFEEPKDLSMKLQNAFVHFAAEELRKTLNAPDVNEDTVVGVHGLASLFGFTKVHLVLNKVEHDIKGRLALFFPGQYENNTYRLLNSGDGWNYLAVPITLHGGVMTK